MYPPRWRFRVCPQAEAMPEPRCARCPVGACSPSAPSGWRCSEPCRTFDEILLESAKHRRNGQKTTCALCCSDVTRLMEPCTQLYLTYHIIGGWYVSVWLVANWQVAIAGSCDVMIVAINQWLTFLFLTLNFSLRCCYQVHSIVWQTSRTIDVNVFVQ